MDKITVGEFFQKIGKTIAIVTVHEDESIEDIVWKMKQHRDHHVVYVLNGDDKIKGIISLGDLTRFYFSQAIYKNKSIIPYKPIIKSLTTEKAKDIMKRTFVFTRLNESLEKTLLKMTSPKVLKLIPVLDEDNRIISSLAILDIIEYQLTSESG